jgi:sugar phosphate isomerase/epimerase
MNRHANGWGYALVWYGDFLTLDADPMYARLKFLKEHGFKFTGMSVGELSKLDDAALDRLGQFLVDNDLRITPGAGYRYATVTPDEAKSNTERIAASLQRLLPVIRGTIVTTGAWGAGHRFERNMPLDEKLEKIGKGIAPLAEACMALGVPLAIENHGDFYCSDVVKLCQATKDLYIFLDTGNTFLIGEQPLPAIEIAAPYTVGTHFKDHHVRPVLDAHPIYFEVAGSAIGEGDVPLREAYELILKHCPFPEKLAMEIEMICPDDMDHFECLKRSLDFVNSL